MMLVLDLIRARLRLARPTSRDAADLPDAVPADGDTAAAPVGPPPGLDMITPAAATGELNA